MANPTVEKTAHPTIQQGSSGPAVTKAQKALIARGYSVGPDGADGVFGPNTRAGVVKYQTDRSSSKPQAFNIPLVVDGIVGPQTWSRLDPDTIRKGNKGSGVKLAQSILKAKSVPAQDPGPLDGDFGPKTETAVKNFQQANPPLVVDGIVGPKTWTALKS